jgi:hypothetical protein
MSDKTFKEQVEEILIPFTNGTKCKDCPRPKVAITCSACITDRILSAYNAELDRIAEGMPKPECCKVGDKGLNNLVFLGAKEYRLSCQAYIQAQKGS